MIDVCSNSNTMSQKLPSFLHETENIPFTRYQSIYKTRTSSSPFSIQIEKYIDVKPYVFVLAYLYQHKNEKISERFKRFVSSKCEFITVPDDMSTISHWSDECQIILLLCIHYFFFIY